MIEREGKRGTEGKNIRGLGFQVLTLILFSKQKWKLGA
jgi:hypothetical protein